MRVSARCLGSFLILSLLIILGACGSGPPVPTGNASGGSLYLQNNIHAQKGTRDIKASYANWTNPGSGHLIIPVNTAVGFGGYRRGFAINNLDNGQTIYFEYNVQRMGMSPEQYINVITSPAKVNLANFSEIDQKGIREGKAYVGMSKNGVRISLGYPATHQTPSLESNTWIYWRNRFKTMAVEFGYDGKIINIKY